MLTMLLYMLIKNRARDYSPFTPDSCSRHDVNNYFVLVQRFSQFIYRVVTHVVTYVNIMITVHKHVTLLPARHCKNNCT